MGDSYIPICLLNSGSLVNKLNDFQSFVYSSSFRIVTVTETWLNNQILNNEILPTNFVIYRKDRDSRGGGVLLAIHESLQSKLLVAPSDLEVLTVQVSGGVSFIVCVVYVPPNKPVTNFDDLATLLLKVCYSSGGCYHTWRF